MIRILGVRVDEINMEDALAAVEKFIAAFHAGQKRLSQMADH